MQDILKVCAAISALMVASCFGPFGGGKAARTSGPPSLQVRFDSATATASLAWERASGYNFSHYAIKRSNGRGFVNIAELETVDDTSFVDAGLQADLLYHYKVVSYSSVGEDDLQPLASTAVQGGIHDFVNMWALPGDSTEFRPTRLVVGSRGTVSVVGVGSGRVARFDRAGNSLGTLEFTTKPLACLETGILDGPALALDSHDNLYVAYNVQQELGAPQAFWSKFDSSGQHLWTLPLEGIFARHIAIDRDDQPFIESISQLQQYNAKGEQLARFNIPALLVASLRFWKGNFATLVEPLQLIEGTWQAPRLVVYEGVERATAATSIGRDPLSAEDNGSGLLKRPTDFVVDETASRAFVVNAGQSRIEVFREGKFLTRWGRQGEAAGHFRFSGSHVVIDDISSGTMTERQVVAGGIARDRRGYIYVADTFNNRIQKFQP